MFLSIFSLFFCFCMENKLNGGECSIRRVQHPYRWGLNNVLLFDSFERWFGANRCLSNTSVKMMAAVRGRVLWKCVAEPAELSPTAAGATILALALVLPSKRRRKSTTCALNSLYSCAVCVSGDCGS